MKPTRETLRRTTAPALLCQRARTTPDKVAFLSKHLGAYRERTWLDYASLVARCAKAFAGLGLKAGQRVAILAGAREEWAICDQAAQTLGAVVCAIDPRASAAEFEHCMNDAGVALLVAETQELVDRLLPVLDTLPGLMGIVVLDDDTVSIGGHPRLLSYPALVDGENGTLAWLEHQVRLLLAGNPAFIDYSSGKPVMISHGAHLAATLSLAETYPTLAKRPHRTVAHLPPNQGLGRAVAITLPLLASLVPSYGEPLDDLATTLVETAPTVLLTDPRRLQPIAAQILIGLADRPPLGRWVHNAALALARRYVRQRWQHKVSFSAAALQSLAHAAVFRPTLRRIGFEALELLICEGTLPEETVAQWHMYGVNLVAAHVDACRLVAGQRGPFPRPGDVEGWSRIAETGPIPVELRPIEIRRAS